MPAVVVLYPVVAGVISAVGSAFLSVGFVRALAIGIVNGLVVAGGTVVGAVMAARIAARASRPIERRVTHLQRAVGAARRETDQLDADRLTRDNPSAHAHDASDSP